MNGILLGVDFGARRVGLAISHDGKTAVPLRVLAVKSRREAVAQVAEAARREGAERIVVGLPRMKSGDLGPTGENVLAFVQGLSLRVGIPVETTEEAYSTVAADAALEAAGVPPRERGAKRDALAAAEILRTWIAR